MEEFRSTTVTTDSNSGITQAEARSLGIRVLPMPIYIDGELFFEDVDITNEAFYERQAAGADIKTSMPSPTSLTEMWDDALKNCDHVIHIPMTSGLSGSCGAAQALAQDYGGRVIVVDNGRISVPLRLAIEDALSMIKAGKAAEEIADILTREGAEMSVYITVDMLKYLKQGGRLSPSAAALGTLLSVKPVLAIGNGKIEAYSKVIGMKAAKKAMFDALEADLDGKFRGHSVRLCAAYTCTHDEALEWKREIEEHFPGMGEVTMDPLTLSVACHTGPGAIGIGCSRIIEE